MTTPAEPEVLWALLEDPSRWSEFDVFVRRIDGTRGAVREGQHLLATSRGVGVRVPVDVRRVAAARHLGLTVHTLPGLRELRDHDVTRGRRGGSELRTSVVLEGPMAPLAVVPVWAASALTARLLGRRAAKASRGNGGGQTGATGGVGRVGRRARRRATGTDAA